MDINGRTPAIGDYAAKALVGKIIGYGSAPDTVVVDLGNGTTFTQPVSCLVTASPDQSTSTWPWSCFEKLCGR